MIGRRELLSLSAYGVVLLALLSLCFWLTSLDFGDFRPESLTVTYVLWALSTFVVFGAIALAFLLFRDLLKLYLERRKLKLGSRIKTKLITGVVALSIAPIALHVSFSITLLNRNFDKWFSQPTVELLDSSKRFLKEATGELSDGLLREAGRLAESPMAAAALRTGQEPDGLRTLLEESGAEVLALLPADGGAAGVELSLDGAAPPSELRSAWSASAEAPRTGSAAGWIYAALAVGGAAGPSGTLVLGRPLPAAILQEQAFMQARVREWQELEAARPLMWRTYVYMLSLVTIFMLFFAVWLAQFVAKQITRPIQALVTATGELAGGHLGYRVETAGIDELGSLIESFNSMGQALETQTGELERSNRDLARANTELDDRRRFIDAILQSITPGVISVGEDGAVLKSNESAQALAGDESISSVRSIAALLDEGDRDAFEHMFSSARRTGIASREFLIEKAGRLQHLAVTVSSVDSENAQQSFVVVLEDTTELVRAQRSEAWQEVARRLAHEIKNPLTPVALAAGRIDRLLERYDLAADDSERADVRERLNQSTRTIHGEVQTLKALVDSFSDLARFPAILPKETDLNEVVRDAAAVFEGRLTDIDLRLDTAPGTVLAMVDPEPMKRVLVNLIDNAADVLQDAWVKEIVVSTRPGAEAGAAELAVADSGPGISAQDREKLFLPEFSTKGRGTGLGLTIVQSIIRDHQGTIRVEDNQPAGTRFIIEVPAARTEVGELEESAA